MLAGRRALEEQSRQHKEVVGNLEERLAASPLRSLSPPQRSPQSPQHSELVLRRQHADLVNEHAELVFELGVEKDLGARRAAQVETLESALESLKAQVVAGKSEKEASEEGLKVENERLREEVASVTALKNERAVSAEGLRKENERLRRDLAAKEGSASGYVVLRQERDALFGEVVSLRAAGAELGVARAENDELRLAMGSLEEEAERQARESKRLVEEVEGLRSCERSMTVLGKENRELRDAKGELEKEVAEMRSAAEAFGELEVEKQELEKQVKPLKPLSTKYCICTAPPFYPRPTTPLR